MTTIRRKMNIDPRIDSTKYVIPFFYEKNDIWKTGETYRVRVSNVYDPSKFWIVGMHKELCTFQTSMMDFYVRHGKQYKLPRRTVKKNTYCVACVNNGYFRGIIVGKSQGIERMIQVFLIDFGFHETVKVSNLYSFHENYYNIPRFGGRARLSNIQPYNTSSWTEECVRRFEALVIDKILLATIENIDPVDKVVHILTSPCEDQTAGSMARTIQVLLDEKLAKRSEDERSSLLAPENNLYLFPTFDVIESGATPSVLKVQKIMNDSSSVAMVKYFIEMKEKSSGK